MAFANHAYDVGKLATSDRGLSLASPHHVADALPGRCYQMPRLLSVGGRGPYAVAITTEHIRTAVDVDGAKTSAKEEELWPLELMAQVSNIKRLSV